MSASNTFENSIMLLIFNNTNIANLGDATGVRGSSTAGSLYIGLHTADPGEAGDQTTSESAYTSYARVAVARSSGGWTVSANTASNTAAIDFPACTGSTIIVTYFSVGAASSGSGILLFSGALSASLAVSTGVTPEFAIGQLTVRAE